MLKPPFKSRLARARSAVKRAGLDAVLVAPSPDLQYLTGASLHMRRRPIFLVVTPARIAMFVPRLEADSTALALPGVPQWTWEDGQRPMEVLRERLGRARRLGVNPVMRADWAVALHESRPQPKVASAAPILDGLRSRKEPGELKLLQAAATQADKVMAEARARLKPGVTEESVGQFVLRRFVDLGAVEPWVSVASGPNGALPHHEFSSRKLRRGDVIVVDLGAQLNGYQSDITRTFFLGEPEPEAKRVYAVVWAAQEAGRAAVRAGTSGRECDRAARELIARHGYGRYFIHRLGHGLGMEVHEEPCLASDNRAPLPSGAVVTVEPGIYLPGRFGIRLEDVVMARSGPALTLTRSPLGDPRLP